MTPRYSWTQPICEGCYDDRYPGRRPSVLIEPELETCVDCGLVTRSGIYLRIDPAEARHPTLKKDG